MTISCDKTQMNIYMLQELKDYALLVKAENNISQSDFVSLLLEYSKTHWNKEVIDKLIADKQIFGTLSKVT